MISSEYLAKVLDGKHLDFKEETLVQEIDPKALVNTIKYLYGIKSLDKNTLKIILKEGAKSNQLLRMKDETFD